MAEKVNNVEFLYSRMSFVMTTRGFSHWTPTLGVTFKSGDWQI